MRGKIIFLGFLSFVSTGPIPCTLSCRGSDCRKPTCTCPEGFSKHPVLPRLCNPICSEPCLNGTCVQPEICACKRGFSLNRNNKYECISKCKTPCKNGKCLSPEVCTCNKGYVLDESNKFQCNPKCHKKCINGYCSSPNVCSCYEGYILDGEHKSLCRKLCAKECLNGICNRSGECICNEGYYKLNEFQCSQIKSEEDINSDIAKKIMGNVGNTTINPIIRTTGEIVDNTEDSLKFSSQETIGNNEIYRMDFADGEEASISRGEILDKTESSIGIFSGGIMDNIEDSLKFSSTVKTEETTGNNEIFRMDFADGEEASISRGEILDKTESSIGISTSTGGIVDNIEDSLKFYSTVKTEETIGNNEIFRMDFADGEEASISRGEILDKTESSNGISTFTGGIMDNTEDSLKFSSFVKIEETIENNGMKEASISGGDIFDKTESSNGISTSTGEIMDNTEESLKFSSFAKIEETTGKNEIVRMGFTDRLEEASISGGEILNKPENSNGISTSTGEIVDNIEDSLTFSSTVKTEETTGKNEIFRMDFTDGEEASISAGEILDKTENNIGISTSTGGIMDNTEDSLKFSSFVKIEETTKNNGMKYASISGGEILDKTESSNGISTSTGEIMDNTEDSLKFSSFVKIEETTENSGMKGASISGGEILDKTENSFRISTSTEEIMDNTEDSLKFSSFVKIEETTENNRMKEASIFSGEILDKTESSNGMYTSNGEIMDNIEDSLKISSTVKTEETNGNNEIIRMDFTDGEEASISSGEILDKTESSIGISRSTEEIMDNTEDNLKFSSFVKIEETTGKNEIFRMGFTDRLEEASIAGGEILDKTESSNGFSTSIGEIMDNTEDSLKFSSFVKSEETSGNNEVKEASISDGEILDKTENSIGISTPTKKIIDTTEDSLKFSSFVKVEETTGKNEIFRMGFTDRLEEASISGGEILDKTESSNGISTSTGEIMDNTEGSLKFSSFAKIEETTGKNEIFRMSFTDRVKEASKNQEILDKNKSNIGISTSLGEVMDNTEETTRNNEIFRMDFTNSLEETSISGGEMLDKTESSIRIFINNIEDSLKFYSTVKTDETIGNNEKFRLDKTETNIEISSIIEEITEISLSINNIYQEQSKFTGRDEVGVGEIMDDTKVTVKNPSMVNNEAKVEGFSYFNKTEGYMSDSSDVVQHTSNSVGEIIDNIKNTFQEKSDGDQMKPINATSNENHVIISCNEGYLLNQNGECTPVCSKQCINSFCSSPNVCTCNESFRPDPKDKFNCVPTCGEKCINSDCVDEGKCVCIEGFIADIKDPFRCIKPEKSVPSCRGECVNGVCGSGGFCSCNLGYEKDPRDDSSCKPSCKDACINGRCVAPGICQCYEKFEFSNKTRACEPKVVKSESFFRAEGASAKRLMYTEWMGLVVMFGMGYFWA